jgi:hypothetical protein
MLGPKLAKCAAAQHIVRGPSFSKSPLKSQYLDVGVICVDGVVEPYALGIVLLTASMSLVRTVDCSRVHADERVQKLTPPVLYATKEEGGGSGEAPVYNTPGPA